MTERTYTYAQLCEAIERAHGRITTPFSLRYPSDPRCRFSLRIHVGCERWNMFWDEAEDADHVAILLGLPQDKVVGFSWERCGDTLLRVVMREN